MNKYTTWTNLRPMYYSKNSSKGSKIIIYLFLLQEIKAKYFMKLIDQEGLNQVFY